MIFLFLPDSGSSLPESIPKKVTKDAKRYIHHTISENLKAIIYHFFLRNKATLEIKILLIPQKIVSECMQTIKSSTNN